MLTKKKILTNNRFHGLVLVHSLNHSDGFFHLKRAILRVWLLQSSKIRLNLKQTENNQFALVLQYTHNVFSKNSVVA